VVQAAAAFARANRGDNHIGAFDYQSWTESGGVHIVSFSHNGEHLVVSLGERRSEPLLSTCAAGTAQAVREFELLSIAHR